ncbi:MAG: hypothetical protein AAGA29_05745 [Planctomycetota bacterium]
MTQAMFPEFDADTVWPEWFTPGKTTPACHKARVQRGMHPLGLPLLNTGGEGPERCGNCAHRCTISMGGTYHKCALVQNTNGPATDLRCKWAACMSYRRGEGFDG